MKRLVGAGLLMWVAACRPGTRSERAPADAPPPPAAASLATSSPDVTAHASAIYDAGASVAVAASVDGAALRAKNLARLKTDRSAVTLLRAEPGPAAALDLGRRICEAVVPQRPKETPVLLKPNIGGFDWFKDPEKNAGDDGIHGRTTDPEFVRGVVRCLHARGHRHITIAEGWGATHKDWERLVRVSGYEKMAREEGVPLVAMDDDGVFDVLGDAPGRPLGVSGMEGTHVPTLLVPKILAEHLAHGMFLSLPKIKAHRFGVLSMSVKGMQGTVMLSDASPAFRQKWRMHRELNPYLDAQKKKLPEDRAAYVAALEAFAERMADVLEIEAPDAVLAEGAPAMGGDGFQKLWPSAESVAIGGTNPVLVDRVGAAFMGLWKNEQLGQVLGGHTTSPLLETAARRFGIDLSSPEVVGNGAALLDAPRPVHFVGMAPFAIHSDDTPPTPPGRFADRSSGAGTRELPERPTAHAAPLGADTINIDGHADEAAWQRAAKITWDTDYAGHPSGIVTHARFLYGPPGLYALFELEGAGLHVDRSRPVAIERVKLYEEDCVEIFLTTDPARRQHYYEIELGPFGHFFDIDVDREAKTSDAAWSSGARVVASQDEVAHTATIEAALTAKEIAAALVPGADLPLGLFRMEGVSPRSFLAWSPPRTAQPNFHVPEAFGDLVLDR